MWLFPSLLASLVNKKLALGRLEKAQALRSFLIPTRDDSLTMIPSGHRGLVGTGVAKDATARLISIVGINLVPLLKVGSLAS